MELEFVTKPMQYLANVLWDRQCKEETVETIVPDSYPDAERIISCHAVAVMRSKEVHQGNAVISGGIRAGVMYVAEGENLPRSLEVYLPFTVQSDCPELTENSSVQFSCKIRSADARIVNSRKILVRVNLCCEIKGFEKREAMLYTPAQIPDYLQTHTAKYKMLLPSEYGERNFMMTEELRMPGNRPWSGDSMCYSVEPELMEYRLAGNKAVFKGVARLHMLYSTEDGNLAHFEAELPFSQYCELQQVYEEETLQICLQLTGCELERGVTQEGDTLTLTLHMTAQCAVLESKEMEFMDDAYTLQGEFSPQWHSEMFVNCLEQRNSSHTVRESKNCEASEIVQTQVFLDFPQKKRVDEGMEITVPATAQITYYDRQGQLQWLSFRTECKETVPMAENVQCRISAALAGDVAALSAGSTVELRYPLHITMETYANQTFKSICGGEIRETEKKREKRPSVIVRRSAGGESLWEIAKANGTTVGRICAANGLETEQSEAGILLIPT